MAVKATIYRASIQLADMDRNHYGSYDLTIARHPSETDERMMVRLLAFALNVPANDDTLELAKDMWASEEPAILGKDLTGQIQHWIEVGQPDERRMMQSCSRSKLVSVYSFSSSTPQWWNTVKEKVTRAKNLSVWQIPSIQSQPIAVLANRPMKLDVTVQDGTVWMTDAHHSLEITPLKLN
jgi:uncharacterized protein YaeQ